MTLLLEMVVRSSLIFAAGLVARHLLRRRSAALRHWVLAAAILAAAAIVPLSFVLPAWSIPSPAMKSGPMQDVPRLSSTVNVSVTEEEAAAARPAALSLMLMIWVAGLVARAGTFAGGLGRLSRVAASAERLQDVRWTRPVEQISAAYGITRQVTILQTSAPDLLATWGLFNPCVLVPADARTWTDDRIHIVLCHELAHISRHDWIVQVTAELLRAIYWFDPLIWIVCTRLRRDSEQACDDAVLRIGVEARHYAAHLLDLARTCRRPAFTWASMTPMARPSTLERRIAAMLNADVDRRRLSGRAMLATAVMLFGVTLPAAAVRPAQTSPLPLRGTLYDTTGAVIPGVELTLADPRLEDAQQVKMQVTSDATGHFEFASVAPGRYILEASLMGFRTLRHEVELRNARDWDRAITLQVGDLRETITVEASRMPPSAAASARQPQPIRVGGAIRPPRKLVDVRPVYPASMRAAGREGVVPIEAVIGRDGTVHTLRVLSAQIHPDFAVAAADAVRQWRFDPTLLNGEPVEVVMTVSVTFRLSE